MFTGIISAIGIVNSVKELPQGRRLEIACEYDLDGIEIGASIAHDGICLTIAEKGRETYFVEAWREALELTNADSWEKGARLNLERALKMGDELGGHLVSGHIDGSARIERIEEEGDAKRFTLDAPENLAQFIAPKGSVALNGTSLTVNQVDGTRFDVLLIRHSLEATNWGERKIGDKVNLEADMIARYVARLRETSQ